MPTIECEAEIVTVGSWLLFVLPQAASDQLPSRGMCMIEGTLDGQPLQAAVEPDGRGGHWIRLDEALPKAKESMEGRTLKLAFNPLEEWPDPTVPDDLKAAFRSHAQASEQWKDITSKARWDWIRWIRSTANPSTRQSRIEKGCSMLTSGKRRPCCFDRSRCTHPDVSSNGKLKVP